MPVKRSEPERYFNGYHEPKTLIGRVTKPKIGIDGSWANFTLSVPRVDENGERKADYFLVWVPEGQIERFSELFPTEVKRTAKAITLDASPFRTVRVPFESLRSEARVFNGRAYGDMVAKTLKIDFDAAPDAYMAVREAEVTRAK
ncbi:hypothetical protein [Streptomyces nodosus]|uniref:hypothetical protein n=1 Tax=Streptomyces nodosus TaxID=40318 RepID=UPI0037F445CE